MADIKIQEVSTPGCVDCAKAKELLESEIKPQFPNVEVEYIDGLSDEGQKMIQEYGIFASPGIIVNEELLQMGRLDKEKLLARIKELS